MTELKKCPFCGSKARINTCSGKYFVECSHENWCETLPKTWLYNTKEEAIEAWNRWAGEMTERLTVRHGKYINVQPKEEIMCSNYCTNCGKADCDHIRTALEKLAHYEDLEEAGKLITLPCKIGDTVWNIRWWDDTTETKVIDGKKYFRRVTKHKVTKSKFSLFDYDDLGKTVFLTKEEAEAALKEVDK